MKKVLRPFRFGKMEAVSDFQKQMLGAGLDFPVDDTIERLFMPLKIGERLVRNRLCSQPSEGFDADPAGAPTEWTVRRYQRFAAGGFGMIWYESAAVSPGSVCHPQQLRISRQNLSKFEKLVKQTAQSAAAFDIPPYQILQLTSAGRNRCDAAWKPDPLVACKNPYLDAPDLPGHAIITDGQIDDLIEAYIDAAVLAMEAGYDAVDVKACHEYLLRELLSAFTRPGKYGGSFENRTRALLAIIDGIQERTKGQLQVCVRLNAYDALPYPYGWGMRKEVGVMEPDQTEPIRLCRMLTERGVRLINLSTTMPRYMPYGYGVLAEREDGPEAEIDPYRGEHCLLEATRNIKQKVPEGKFVCTGLTWLEQFGWNVAAGGIRDEYFDVAGFSRQAMAYPDFPNDLLQQHRMKRERCCLTCDRCYDLVQPGIRGVGCVLRDQVPYLEEYRRVVQKRDVETADKG